ncbi:MAG: iron chelate uptake ABC transporter family permease subunit, partial [Burkholderiales bacterium]|nr:iron chelate uptake ABC transporter family permease subunit [Burkholderiales bacterium]
MNKAALFDPAQSHPGRDEARRRHLVVGLLLALLALAAAGLFAGSEGWSWPEAGQAGLIVGRIRAPRTLGAGLVGALLGLAGAVAQGLFRNPLADPYLLGTASGASLAVVGVLAAGAGLGAAGLGWLLQIGLVGAAFVGALAGVALTLAFARGAGQPMRLLLSGVVVGVVLGAASDLVTTAQPEALRGRQAFMLGST